MKTIHERINERSAMGGINIFKASLDWSFDADSKDQPVMCRKWVSALSRLQRSCYFNCYNPS
jgi:hypothetical protein